MVIFSVLLIIFGLVGVVASLYNFSKTAKNFAKSELLDKVYEAGEITEKTYIKHSKEL
jgi:uncharacterized membrane protein